MNRVHKNIIGLIQYFYIYVMMSSAGMALPAYIGNDNFYYYITINGNVLCI